MIVLTALIGTFFVKAQVMGVIEAFKQHNGNSLLLISHGLLLLIVGIVLITPGFISDLIGFILLIPYIRKLIINKIFKNFVQI